MCSGDTSFSSSALEDKLTRLYAGAECTAAEQLARYGALAQSFKKRFGSPDMTFFSAPGRAEIGGNHTDHNGGKVLAAAITLDTIAAAAPSGNDTITVFSGGFPPVSLNLADLSGQAGETGTSALLRGIAAGFRRSGFSVEGFNACLSSQVLGGSGLSSSAAVEMVIGAMVNDFFNGGKIEKQQIARIGQAAEHLYWNKPCGLMDQIACGLGSFVNIDFKDAENPLIRRIEFDFRAAGYKVLVVDTGGDHGALSQEYGNVPAEMFKVARFFKKERCVDLSEEEILAVMPALRRALGERCILRALHFFDENRRVDGQAAALQTGDFMGFLSLVNESGLSSWRLLQNCYDIAHVDRQEIPVGLTLTERFFARCGVKGACRVHGGGFAGTILVIMPEELVTRYRAAVQPVFGDNCCQALGIRPQGAVNVTSGEW